MLPLSKMQFVLFAAVLTLSVLQSGALLSRTETRDCVQLLIAGAITECQRHGYDYFETYDKWCKLKCNGDGTVPMPKGVCYGGKVDCTEGVKNILLKWTKETENRKLKITTEWCRSQGK
uniref:Putative secreted WC salivary gland protein n=1 Tax=Ixodes scapularis TaxID=6945 RepID=Q4PN90_IXOSC|nr:putative secreted WC salivary gland protein [Ixodes scapularis]